MRTADQPVTNTFKFVISWSHQNTESARKMSALETIFNRLVITLFY